MIIYTTTKAVTHNDYVQQLLFNIQVLQPPLVVESQL